MSNNKTAFARIPTRPLSYEKIGGISRYMGKFDSKEKLPTTNVRENDYAHVNENTYKYNNGEWIKLDEDFIDPTSKELIIDYLRGIMYICTTDNNIVKVSSSYIDNIITTLLADNWEFDFVEGSYVQTLYINNIFESDYPVVDVILSDTYNVAENLLNEYGKIYRILTFDGYIKVYANDKICTDLDIIIKVDR